MSTMELSNVPVNDKPMTTGEDETATPPTKQQKLIKAALLLGLALVIVYVILDYTVSQRSITCWCCGHIRLCRATM